MKLFPISLVTSVCFMAAIAWPHTSIAQTVSLSFQTTFNIPEWNQSLGISDAQLAPAGDGIRGEGNWTTTNGSMDQVTLAANYPGGGGGRGYRHWVGDGPSNNGGGIEIFWPATSEYWLRYYVRFQIVSGWQQSVFMKMLYILPPGTFYFGFHDSVVGGHVESDSVDHGFGLGNHKSTVSWSVVDDTNWHCMEVHAKMNPVGGVGNGVFEFWLDGAKIYSNSSVNFTNSNGQQFSGARVGENAHSPANGGVDFYVDFDDFAISNSGYIGPIGIPSPKNLRVQ